LGMVMDMDMGLKKCDPERLTLCHLFCGPLPDRWSIVKPVLVDGLSFCGWCLFCFAGAATSILFLWAPRKPFNQSGLIR